MSTLRARLAETAPELHAALERSWKIALEEWLPAIPPSLDSSNSYPHLRNIENHLDQVLASPKPLLPRRQEPELRPAEIYILLASVLFHDIGRAKRGSPHAVISYEDIVRKHGNLGIRTLELAKCVAAVCLGHDAPEQWNPRHLYDVVVDPYGEIRQRTLRALLVLGDHMDGTQTRSTPPYLKTGSDLAIVGLFRSHLRGVYADCPGQMVRAVLTDLKPWPYASASPGVPPATASTCTAHYTFVTPDNARQILDSFLFPDSLRREITERALETRIARLREEAGRTEMIRPREPSPDTRWVRRILASLRSPDCPSDRRQVLTAINTWIGQHVPLQPASALWDFLDNPNPDSLTFTSSSVPASLALDWLVAMGLLDVRLDGSTISDGGVAPTWPHPSLLAVIMRDVAANDQALQSIADDLAAVGLPMRAWLLDHREHLYTSSGAETYEPVFHKTFLKRVAKAMWTLSEEVFGCSRFTYEELASQAREPNVPLVRRAVRRLAIVERCELPQLDPPESRTNPTEINEQDGSSASCDAHEAIWAGDTHWRWLRRNAPATQCSLCRRRSDCSRHILRTQPGSALAYLSTLISKLAHPL